MKMVRPLNFLSAVMVTGLLTFCSRPVLELKHVMDLGKGTETISIQSSTKRAVVSNSETGIIYILDISDPANLKLKTTLNVGKVIDGEITGVAFHPIKNFVLVTIQSKKIGGKGSIVRLNAGTGEAEGKWPSGVDPDDVGISPDGRYAVIPNEGEHFIFDQKKKQFKTRTGSVTILHFNKKFKKAKVFQLSLKDMTEKKGWLSMLDDRGIKRKVDYNKNGKYDKKVDWDKNGKIEDKDVVVGTYDGQEVTANEKKGEKFLIPLRKNSPALLEPERVAISKANRAIITLQEANGVIIVDLAQKKVIREIGLGKTRHDADIKTDNKVDITAKRNFLREPDGVDFTPDGQHFLTADEGDTDALGGPKKEPVGGGRSISLFSYPDGNLLADSGAQLDKMAHKMGIYPDERSSKRGAEPETVKAFEFNGGMYAVVALERANALALADLHDFKKISILSLKHVNPKSKKKQAPEGVDLLRRADGTIHIVCANEKSGTVSSFVVRK